jgi:hypothetical protein
MMQLSSVRMSRPVIAFLVCCGFLLISATSCQWLESDQENFLFVFVEDLGFDSISCGREREYPEGSGFHVLCTDSVQFSHAYTNSPMSVSALASFFTASSADVHRTGAGATRFLSAQFKVLPEVAWERGLSTWMLSGGPPVFRKAGFAQGFEVFDDHVALNVGQLFKPFKENILTFEKLLNGPVKRGFFTVFFVPDLVFHETETVDQLGLPREKSYEGQLEEINASLGELFANIKRRKIWSNTHIVVAGVNAKPKFDRPGEQLATNLYSERVHIALFVKPARGGRGEHPQTWKVNHNVSLADLGATYFDCIEGRFSAPKSPLSPTSLKPILNTPGSPWNVYRPIEVASDWAEWRKIGNTRRSLRVGYDFYLYDYPPLVFNTLVDHMEMVPVVSKDSQAFTPEEQWERVYQEPIDVWLNVEPSLLEKVKWAKVFFGSKADADSINPSNVWEFLEKRRPGDIQVAAWFAQWALERFKWEILEELGLKYNQPFWLYVARAHLGNGEVFLDTQDCGEIFREGVRLDRRATLKDCNDTAFVELINSVREGKEDSQGGLEGFLNDFFLAQSARRIGELNYLKGMMWDVSLTEPKGPSLSQLFLHLPGNESLRNKIQTRWRARLSPR